MRADCVCVLQAMSLRALVSLDLADPEEARQLCTDARYKPHSVLKHVALAMLHRDDANKTLSVVHARTALAHVDAHRVPARYSNHMRDIMGGGGDFLAAGTHAAGASDETAAPPAAAVNPLLLRWQQLQGQWHTPSAAMDDLLKLTGLDEIKELFFQLYAQAHISRQQQQPLSKLAASAVFEGNPGTGKCWGKTQQAVRTLQHALTN